VSNPAVARQPFRVLVVDDHPLVRHGLREMLAHQPKLLLCGETDSAAEALELCRVHAPELVIVDISLKDTNGIELIKRLRKQSPRLKALVLSMHDEAFYAERALRAGARGYVSKQEAPERVLEAIWVVMNGGTYLSPEMTSRVLQIVPMSDGGVPRAGVARLTDRELEVFDAIGRGVSTREIAEILSLSVKTVESHRENIKRKLAIKTGGGLSREAYEWRQRSQGSRGAFPELSSASPLRTRK